MLIKNCVAHLAGMAACKTFACFAVGLVLQANAISAPVEEYVFLIDTSSSMVGNKLVGPLQVALYNYAATIPIDGNCHVRIFTFDRGLGRDVMDRALREAKDLEDVKIFLATREYKGSSTHIFRALDGVLQRLDKSTAEGKAHDIRINLFTDGENLGPGTFADNVRRLNALREKPGLAVTLFYHGLGVRPDRATSQLIEQTEGIYFVDGLALPPKAVFLPSAEQATDTTPLTFVNKTRGTADRWQWEFGDGTTSPEESPTHVFREPATYTVRLTASNEAGPSMASRQITIKGGPPKAMFVVEEPDKPKYVGRPVSFKGQSEGRITTWSWDFGDGQREDRDRNPTHTYNEAGTFKVVLALNGPFGNDEFSDFVKVSQPAVVALSFFPESPKHGQDVKFSDDSVGEYKEWRWDFGDGTQSQERRPTHVFAKAGAYTVTLSAQGVDGTSKKAAKEIKVATYPPPEARFSLPVTSIEIGEPVVPTDESTGKIDEWRWDLGDGTVAKTQTVRHVFVKPGRYAIRLTVIGPDAKDSFEAEIVVKEAALVFLVTPAEPRCKSPVLFGNESVGRFKNYRWDFGDGASVQADERSVSHEFEEAGTYTVTLSALGPDKEEWTTSQQVVVKPAAEYVEPAIAFRLAAMTKAKGRPPLDVRIENRCTGSIQSYVWDFGDGTTTDSKAPAYTYDKEGQYTITLTVIDQKDQKFPSTDSQAIRITVLPPPIVPWQIQAIAAAVLYLLGIITFRRWPGKQDFRFEVDATERGRHRKPKGKKFLWEGDHYLGRDSDSFSDGFEVIMRRDFLLRKRYYFRPLNGQIRAMRKNGKSLKQNRLIRGAIVKIGETHETVFRKLDDGIGPALLSQLCIVAPILVLLILGLKFLG